MSLPIYQLDPEIAQAIGDAYQQVCKALHDAGQPQIVRDVIFEKITAAAKAGERDPIRLRDIALESFGLIRHDT